MRNTIKLSVDQAEALKEMLAWVDDPKRQVMTFGGYAGSGKSTLIREFVNRVGAQRVQVASYTGKAVSVLRSKGLVQARTLHNLLYRPVGEDDETGDVIFQAKSRIDGDLVVVDEASMVNDRLHRDLLSVAAKVLYVGDHGQLEPIGGNPGLMKNPDIRLEKIHRQAASSPILPFAHALREGVEPLSYVPLCLGCQDLGRKGACPEHGASMRVDNRWPQDLHKYDAVIVAKNAYRRYLNNHIREMRKFEGPIPCPGEILICLANNKDLGIFNGLQIEVIHFTKTSDLQGLVTFQEETSGIMRHVPLWLPQLGSTEQYQRDGDIWQNYGLFDWGYALTAHKSQGSQWKRGCVIEKDMPHNWNLPRWRYTAATRFSEELFYVVEGRKKNENDDRVREQRLL